LTVVRRPVLVEALRLQVTTVSSVSHNLPCHARV